VAGMLITGVDFETTGLDCKVDRIIEIGAVLWDTDRQIPLKMLSCFVDPERDISPEITEITGITGREIASFAMSEGESLENLYRLEANGEFLMAHNAEFDRGFYNEASIRSGVMDESTRWLCSKNDVAYPEKITTRNLRHLAAEHGFLNPFSHRAVFDVLTMFKVVSCYKIEDIIARAAQPTVYVQAIVSFDEKEKAKARGYYWHGPTKAWWRSFKEPDYLKEKEECGFRTVLLQKAPESL
jgi:DNA polymerase III subunit epsilon